MTCGNCGRPLDEHCDVHAIPCCPGTCSGPAVAAEEAGPPPPEPNSVQDAMRRAMLAQGIDPDEVARIAETEGVIPDDADEQLRQAAAATGAGMRCKACKGPVDPRDPNMLVEVIGWSKHRSQGGQNHVIDRAETGLVMCGECSLRLQHLGPTSFAQEAML